MSQNFVSGLLSYEKFFRSLRKFFKQEGVSESHVAAVIECLPKIREQIQAATNLSRNRVARIKSEERSEARRRRNIKPIASQTFVHGMVPYQRRNKLLSEMRFGSYAEYLESDLWKEIRNRVLIRDGLRCRVCASEATQVHHKSYDRCVLAGESIDQLISICETCHEAIEFG